MTSPATHSNPLNAENEMLLQIINRRRERQITVDRKAACTGYLFSSNMPAMKEKKSLRNGACFQIGFFPEPLFSIVKYFTFYEAIILIASSCSYFTFFNGYFGRCLNGIHIRCITVFCTVFIRD